MYRKLGRHRRNHGKLESLIMPSTRKVDTASGRGPGVPPQPDTGTPRWVIVFGLIAAALLVVFLTVHLAGGGLHHHGADLPRASTAHSPGRP